jgi:tRNA threonylcarbamoyladenosine biosynthesis protein TsaE
MTILDELAAGVICDTPESTELIGARLAAALPHNVAVALSGDLGAGKTTLVRGMARGLGIQGSVTSPTYTIYTIHSGDRQLLHMDAYRLGNAGELESLALDEFLKPPYLIAVEWPEHIPAFFEDYTTYWFKLTILPDHRHRIQRIEPR